MATGAVALGRAAGWADVIYTTGIYSRSSLASAVRQRPLVVKLVNDPAFERAAARGWYGGTLEEFQARSLHPGVTALKLARNVSLRVPTTIVVPSRYLARLAEGWGVGPARGHVVPNPAPRVDLTEERESVRRALGVDCPTAVFAGRFVRQKDLPTLVRAFAQVQRGKLVLIGDGPERAELNRHLRELGLGERVRVLPSVSRGEAIRWMRAADVTVIPSAWENFPHAAVESLAAGTPVVATAVGGIPEIVQDGVNGLLVPTGDDRALAGALERVLRSDGERARLRDGVAMTGTLYTERAVFERIEALVVAAAG